MKKLIYILLTPLLLFSSCFKTDQSDPPYSEKKVKSLIEKKYGIKGQLEFVETEKLRRPPFAENKYTYRIKETGVQFWAIAKVSVPHANGFLPFITDIFGYDRTYSDSYESYLIMQKRAEAQALAKKYNIQLITTDTLVNNVYDKIYLKDANDINSAANLALALFQLYKFPQKKYSEIDAYIRFYNTIDDTISSNQEDDIESFANIEYRKMSNDYAAEYPKFKLNTAEDIAYDLSVRINRFRF